MIYVIWPVLVIIALFVDIVGIIIVPIAIACSDGTRLPHWAWPWDNDREPLGDEKRGAEIAAATGFKRGWLRYVWLAWRNPGNNFAYALGVIQSADIVYTCTGDMLTSDQGHPGTLSVRAYRNGKLVAFCFYGVWRWHSARCLRVFIGYKIHDMIHDGTLAQLVCVINPVMTFKGE